MKLVLLGVPAGVSDEKLTEALGNMAANINANIKVNILDGPQFIPESAGIPVKPRVTSKFIRAVSGVLKLCGSPVEDVAFRAEFYKQCLTSAIERPILEIIAFGPNDKSDLMMLQRHSAERLPEYAKIALSLIV